MSTNNPTSEPRPYAAEVYVGVGQCDMMTGFERARHFHATFGMPVRFGWELNIPVSERLLRGKLLIEEVLETIKAMGLRLKIVERDPSDPDNWDHPDSETSVPKDDFQYLSDSDTLVGFEVEHVEGSRYDPVETADGLADIKVICNGTAVAFGIPQDEVDLEVFCSNMTKLDPVTGKPIINRCVNEACKELNLSHDECDDPTHLIKADAPVGKALKPDTYTPANIAGLRESYLAGADI